MPRTPMFPPSGYSRRTLLGRAAVVASALSLVRLDRVVAQDASPAATPEPDFVALFDGTAASFADWTSTGQGRFELIDGAIVTGSATFNPADLGLLYYAPRGFSDFILRVQFRISDPADNSGVLVRFRNPAEPPTAEELAAADAATRYPNRVNYTSTPLWIAVDTGFEAQINGTAELIADASRDDSGAIWNIPVGSGAGEQDFRPAAPLQLGEWNDMEVEVVGDTYTVRLNGQQTTTFTNPDPQRGLAASEDPRTGYIGLQTIPFTNGHLDFRAIRIRELPAAGGAATPTA